VLLARVGAVRQLKELKKLKKLKELKELKNRRRSGPRSHTSDDAGIDRVAWES
jgi:hypothetical protein